MKTLVIIPTYNERESLPKQINQVFEHSPKVDILVVDDNSPDGTGAWVKELQQAESRVHLLPREKKAGLGAAYRAGFAWGLERDYDVLVEMDADGSHQGKYLPGILSLLDSSDVAIGSRWVSGGAVENWPKQREFLSRGANTYVRLALGISVKDATAGYRAFKADVLKEINLDDVSSQGYCFQVDMTWRVLKNGRSVAEYPITFIEREEGVSKMSGNIIREALFNVTKWGIGHRWGQVTSVFSKKKG